MMNILSVSPLAADHTELSRILGRGRLSPVATLAGARTALTTAQYPVVVCESNLQPGDWRELLQSIQGMAHPPALIVTSVLADNSLRAEALNLGAYDVLAKPFYEAEVTRVVNLACLRWQREHGPGVQVRRRSESATHPAKKVAITVKEAAVGI
jgi:DNA-binding response OmpR family regulator